MATQTTSLTFYGGVDEIGGNKILLQDRDTRVFSTSACLSARRSCFIHRLSCHHAAKKAFRNWGFCPKSTGSTSLTSHRHKLTPCSFPTGTSTIRLICRLLNGIFPFTAAKPQKPSCKRWGGAACRFWSSASKTSRFKPFRTGSKIRVGSLEVEPIHVDHSVPGAYGFVIHTSNGSIVYTGDFREHALNLR